MKSNFRTSLLISAICTLSVTANAGEIFRSNIETTIDSAPNLIYVKDLGRVNLVSHDNDSRVFLNLTVAADSKENLQGFLSNWTVGVERLGNVVKLSRASISMVAGHSCAIMTSGSSIKSLKGACTENLTISIPRNLQAVINAGNVIALRSKDEAPIVQTAKLITQQQVDMIGSRIKKASFASDKVDAAKDIVAMLLEPGNLKIGPKQMASILSNATFDSDKVAVLRIFASHLSDRAATYPEVIQILSFSSSKDEVATIILMEK